MLLLDVSFVVLVYKASLITTAAERFENSNTEERFLIKLKFYSRTPDNTVYKNIHAF
jgi:hypothetical protein